MSSAYIESPSSPLGPHLPVESQRMDPDNSRLCSDTDDSQLDVMHSASCKISSEEIPSADKVKGVYVHSITVCLVTDRYSQ